MTENGGKNHSRRQMGRQGSVGNSSLDKFSKLVVSISWSQNSQYKKKKEYYVRQGRIGSMARKWLYKCVGLYKIRVMGNSSSDRIFLYSGKLTKADKVFPLLMTTQLFRKSSIPWKYPPPLFSQKTKLPLLRHLGHGRVRRLVFVFSV